MKNNRIALFSVYTLLLLIIGIFIYIAIKVEESSYNTTLTLELDKLTNEDEIIQGCTYVECNSKDYLIKVNNKILSMPISTTKVVHGLDNRLILYGNSDRLFEIISKINDNNLNLIRLKNLSVTLILNNHDCLHYIGKETTKYQRNRSTEIIHRFKKTSGSSHTTKYFKTTKEYRDIYTNRFLTKYGFNKYRWFSRIQNRRNEFKNFKNDLQTGRFFTDVQKKIPNKKKGEKVQISCNQS